MLVVAVVVAILSQFQFVTVTLTAMSMVIAALMCITLKTVLVSHTFQVMKLHVGICIIPTVPECENGEIRLVGGGTNSTGRLEVCINGIWGKVCNALGYWGTDNARVVCRQLGFSEDGEIPVTAVTIEVHLFPPI